MYLSDDVWKNPLQFILSFRFIANNKAVNIYKPDFEERESCQFG